MVFRSANNQNNRDLKQDENKTILIVDDIDVVLTFTTEVLRDEGYQVLTASNGSEALMLCENSNAKIDLVLADVIMPGMDGMEFYEKLRKLCPEMNIILTSMYPLPYNFRKKHPECRFVLKSHETTNLTNLIASLLKNPTYTDS
jgi:CheY-like chemotaxis protein